MSTTFNHNHMSKRHVDFRKEVKDVLFAAKHLIHYIRDEKGNPYGVVVATRTGDMEVSIGFSVCHRGFDRYDKYKGLYVALSRAYKHMPYNPVPSFMVNDVNVMIERAKKYFKTDFIVNELGTRNIERKTGSHVPTYRW
jgi:hypothetical protein